MRQLRKPVRLDERLLQRLQVKLDRTKRHPRSDANNWDGKTYGTGAGQAHPSVEFTTCPHCSQPPGQLCKGPYGLKFSVHYRRKWEFRALKHRVRQDLERKET